MDRGLIVFVTNVYYRLPVPVLYSIGNRLISPGRAALGSNSISIFDQKDGEWWVTAAQKVGKQDPLFRNPRF